MSALGSLVVKLALEYAQFTGGLQRSEQDALRTADRVQATFVGMKDRIAGVAGAVAGGLAAAFTIDAIKGLIGDVVETGAALDDLAKQTGSTVEALSALAAVGKYNDMSAEAIGASMNKLTAQLAGAKEGAGGAAAGIKALGLDLGDFKKLKPEDQIQAISKALDGFQDGAGKSAVMMALYGEQGAKMLPFMADLASVGELQAKITTEQAAAAANLGDNWGKLTATGSSTAKEIATGMVPAMDKAVQAAMDVMAGTGGMREQLRALVADGSIERWTKMAITGISYVVDAFEGAIRVIKSVGKWVGAELAIAGDAASSIKQAFISAKSGDFSGAFGALTGSAQRAKTILGSVADDIKGMWSGDTLGQKFRASLEKIGTAAGAASGATEKAKLNFENAGTAAKKAGGSASSGAAKLAESGADLAKSLLAQDSGLSGDFEKKWDSLSAAYKSGAISLDILTSAQAALLAQQPAMKAAQDAAVKAAQAGADARQKESDGIREWFKAQEQAATQSLAAVGERVTGLQDEAAALDLSRAQNVSLAEAVEMLAIARMEEAQAAKFYEGSEGWQALQREIDARKELLGLMSTKAVREKEEAGWADIWKSVDGTAHDVFVNIFEGGQDAFTKLRDTLKATLLDLLYQMTVKKWIVNIGASVTGGMSGAASAATSSGSGMPSLGGMSNLLGGANPLTEFGMASTNAFYSLGGMATNAGFTSLGSTITANATAMGNFASIAGDALGYLNSMKAIADGQYGAGIGGAIGTYFGGPIGSFIGSKIGGMIDSAVAGETRSGATYDTGADGKVRYQQGPSGGEIAADSARAMFTAAQDSINATLKAVGSSATLAGYTAGLESSKNGKGFEFAGGYVGGKSFGENLGRDGRQFAMHSQDSQAAFTAYGLQLSQSIVEALQAAGDIPDTIKNVIDDTLKGASASSLGGEAVTALLNTINAVVVSVNGFNAVVKTLPFENLKGLGFDAAAGLIAAAGGMDALGSSLTGYYDNFYSDEEKRLQTIKNINSATAGSGLDAATATRASFRALVEAQDVTTESGRKTYLALMGASSAFASITPAADAAGEAVDDLSSKMRDAAQAALTTAADDLAKAREAELSVMQETASGLQASIDKFRDFSKSIRDFRDGLKLSALSPLTPAQRYAEAQKQFADAEKSSDAGKLQSASTALLEASRVYNASSGAYTSDFDRVQSALTLAANHASASADVAQLQLMATQSQLNALTSIDKGVLSVADAISALSSAVLAAVAAGVNPGTENIASLTGGVQNEWVGSAYSSSAGAGAVNTGSGISISTPDGRMFTGMDAVNAVNSMLSAGNTRGVYDSAKDAGISLASLDQLMGWKPMEAEDWAKANGLPLFERGTNYVGADTLAYLHQGEAVVPRAYNPAADGRQARDDGALLAEIRLMRQENNLLRDELRQLRQQQSVETGAVIAATHAASARNAETISSKQSRAAWSKSPELA